MITRIEVNGFKSLDGFALDLSPLTAIVGANGCGKSNLFDALRMLSCLATTNVRDALAEGRGSRRDQFSRAGEEAGHEMSFLVELLLAGTARNGGPTQTRVSYRIEIERQIEPTGLEEIRIRRERAVAIRSDQDRWIEKHSAFTPMAKYGDQGSGFERTGSFDDTLNPYTRAVIANPDATDPFAFEIGEELRAFRFLHLEPIRLRAPSERSAPRMLAPDGSNLPTALAALAPVDRAWIKARLAEIIPGFRSFEIVPVGDELQLEMQFIDGLRLPARVLSDGTLRLVALLTLAASRPHASLIAVEEFENGIHPGAIRTLVETLVRLTQPRGSLPPQVLLNSHSPAVVAALHGHLQSLVFADMVRRGHGVRTTRMRYVRMEGDPMDRGATRVSPKEVEWLLDTARPMEEALDT